MEFFKETKIDFMRLRRITLGISIAVILAGVVSYVTKGGLSYGVDFAGGMMVQIKFAQSQDVGNLRNTIDTLGFAGSRIQQLEGENEFILKIDQSSKGGQTRSEAELDAIENKVVEAFRSEADRQQAAAGKIDLNTSGIDRLDTFLQPFAGTGSRELAGKILDSRDRAGDLMKGSGGLFKSVDDLKTVPGMTDAVYSAIKDRIYLGGVKVIKRDMVGPQVGEELRWKGIAATVWALIGMLVYIWIRFQFVYGLSVILTLTHDVLVTLACISIFNYDMDLTVLAAILTIVGYSVNDTIVIFDRIRDNLKVMKKDSLSDICNKSVNQTLSRTILTSGTVFVTVLSLFLFGGDVIHPFAFTMLVGVISGSYSTIYISCPILLWWKDLSNRRLAKQKERRKAA